MSNKNLKESKVTRRRLRTSYFTSLISISLLLFLLGLIGLLLLNTQRLSVYVKENIGFTVLLKNDIKEIDVFIIQKSLDAKPYVKSTEYITRDQAAKELSEDLGEDFVAYLEHNPLPPTIDVKLYAQYANPDSIEVIEKHFQEFSQVQEVVYQKSLIHLINENVQKISLIILAFSIMLFLIATALINNTIRLSIYSKRFLINTMQLVGATNGFIRKPFLIRGILQGSYGAIVAIILISTIIYYSREVFTEFLQFSDIQVIGILYICILSMGILISIISTLFAVNKYLNINIDKLYV
jgi:cell division transport system permease protein